MKYKYVIVSIMYLLMSTTVFSGNYDGFKVSVYTTARDVSRMSDLHWLDSTWNIISSQMKVDKIYLETFRTSFTVSDEALEQAKKFFHDKGIEVGGGITYTLSGDNGYRTPCYSDPEDRKIVQQIAEYTAKHFDDIILDDFFFTNCKSDVEIKAKDNRSWSQYRMDLMTEAGQNLVIKPAKKVNPKVKIIIKYPNWYDEFPGLGFSLQTGPQIFDGVWSGTEARDPSDVQHLQNYLSYNIFRYFDNLHPSHNYGGWVDNGGLTGMDRYAEQLWLTFFAKAPEIALFNYGSLISTRLNPDRHRTTWQGQGTSFDYDEMMKPVNLNGKTVTPTTLARVAGYTMETINVFISKLGKPIGIKSYKPFHSFGEDYLQNYLGMIGLPMDMYSEFPTDQKVVLLTEQAQFDPDIINKIKGQLTSGNEVVITSGLLKAIPEKIADIAELRATDTKVLVNDFGAFGKSDKDILITQVRYLCNDAVEMLSAGRPLANGVSGYPMLIRTPYSKGHLYVMTIPEDFGNIYDLPVGTLNTFRQILGKDLDIQIDAPAKVALFLYDNGTFIVESFLDEPVTIGINAKEGIDRITDMISGTVVNKLPVDNLSSRRFRPDDKTNVFRVTLPPHSYRVFTIF